MPSPASDRRFIQCDVFTSTPCRGNALAVVIDADGLDTDTMQQFAAWTNLAETTFLLPPTDPSADYRVRIFTPAREMPFAGHPTLGSCAAWLKSGGNPENPELIRQQCEIGIVEIDYSGDAPAFVAPHTKILSMDQNEQARIMTALSIKPEDMIRSAVLDNGPVWHAFELASADAVLDLDASRVGWPDFKAIGVIGAIGESGKNRECDYEVRMLAPSSGMSEDPITGSLNAALARWFAATNTLNRDLTIAQGTQIARTGRVIVRRHPLDEDRILIGGHTHILIEGTVRI